MASSVCILLWVFYQCFVCTRAKTSNFAIGLIFTISLVPKCRSCQNSKTSSGLTLANCTNLNYHEVPKLPDDVQIVDFSKNPNLELRRFFLMNYRDTIIRLIMRENVYASRVKMGAKGMTLDVFSKLVNLEEFDFSSSYLSNDHQWILPSGLKKYIIDDNQFSYLDLSWCLELEELSVNSNYLEALPKFHHPLPPLTTLRAKKNPFNKLTLLDIAPFCYLVVLELEFPSYANLAKQEGYCNCTSLKQFAKEMEITGVANLNCFNGTEAQSITCTNDTLVEARKIRKTCPLLTKGTLSGLLKKILKIVFFSVLLLLFLATLILYIIRHFHLRERWHDHLFPPPTPRMEEAEEELSFRGQGSISDGSFTGEISSTPAP